MKKPFLFATLAAFFAATTVVSKAQAQTESATEKPASPFSVRVGVGHFSEDNLDDILGDYNGTFGVSYQLPTKNRKLRFRLDADYVRGTNVLGLGVSSLVPQQVFTQRFSTTNYGLTANALFQFSNSEDNSGPYAGLGLGVYRSKTRIKFEGSDGEETAGVAVQQLQNEFNNSKTKFGGKLLLGYRANRTFYGELAYNKIGDINGGADPSYYSFQLGANF